MRVYLAILMAFFAVFAAPASATTTRIPVTSDQHPRPAWGVLFDDANVTGTIAVWDDRYHQGYVYNRKRAETRYGPASTFKIPHALFALDAGIAKDAFHVFKWDGTKHRIPAWNQDQTLHSSMRHSTVWVYRGIARALGAEKEKQYIERIGYGNQDTSGQTDMFGLTTR